MKPAAFVLAAISGALLAPSFTDGAWRGPGRGGDTPGTVGPGYHKPLSIPQETAYRLVTIQDGQAWGQPQTMVTVANIQTEAQVSLYYPGRDSRNIDRRSDPNVLELLKGLKPGDIVDIKGGEYDGHHVLTYINVYRAKQGEEEPGVFVFKGRATQKIADRNYAAIAVSKFFQSATVLLPQVKDAAGKMAPDPTMSSEIGKLKTGDLVFVQAEVVGENTILRGIQPYTPPLRGEFVKYSERKKVGEDTFATIEVKTGSDNVTLRIPNYKNAEGYSFADRAMTACAETLKPGQTVEYRVRSGDAANTVYFLRAGSEQKPKQEKPAKAEGEKAAKAE